jgi:hypothetical protein
MERYALAFAGSDGVRGFPGLSSHPLSSIRTRIMFTKYSKSNTDQLIREFKRVLYSWR